MRRVEWDENGYPTREWLESLETMRLLAESVEPFELPTPLEVMEVIEEAWRNGVHSQDDIESGQRSVEDVTYASPGRKIRVWKLATLGWSGNERIISHFERSVFWWRYWESSHRGGGYVFHIPVDHLNLPTLRVDGKTIHPEDSSEDKA